MSGPNVKITRAVAYAVPYPLFGRPHSHPDDFQVLYVVRGDSGVRIGETELTARPEDLYIVKPGQVHASYDERDTAPALWELKCMVSDAGKCPVDPYTLPDVLTEVREPGLLDAFRRLIDEYSTAGPGWEWLCAHLVDELFFRIARLAAGHDTEGGKSSAARLNAQAVARAKAHLEGHFDEELSLSALARVAGLSESHFSALFRELYGRAPIDYLIEVRIDNAARLLLDWQHSVSEVAEMTGFGSVHYFCRQLHRRRGVSPSEYRGG